MKSLFPVSFVCLLLSAPNLPAVVALQVDGFPTLDPAGWAGGAGGGGTPPTVTPGGPDGNYLVASASNFHLGMKNQAQWGGDYLNAAVTAIDADILGDASLNASMRVFLFGPGGTWSTLDPVMVAAGSGWGRYRFELTASDLVLVPPGSGSNDPGAGTGILNDTLASVQTVLFRHNTGATPSSTGSHADHVTGELGFDNIAAVPEPGTPLMWFLGSAAFLLLRRRPPEGCGA